MGRGLQAQQKGPTVPMSVPTSVLGAKPMQSHVQGGEGPQALTQLVGKRLLAAWQPHGLTVKWIWQPPMM